MIRAKQTVFFIFFFILLISIVDGQTVEESILINLKHADTYYWYGMAEKGNMEAYKSGLAYLDKAEELICISPLSDSRKSDLEKKVVILKEDILTQADIAHDTLYGVFPLIRLLAPSLFIDPLATGTFELLDDPDIIASTSAVGSLVNQVLSRWIDIPQLDVICTSTPYNISWVNEALYIFNISSGFLFIISLRL